MVLKTNIFKNNINFSCAQCGVGSAVNSGLVDSCRYLEPDVVILGLGRERGKKRWREESDDGFSVSEQYDIGA